MRRWKERHSHLFKMARVTLTEGRNLASVTTVGLARLAVCIEILDDETIYCPNDVIGRFGSLFTCKGPRTLWSAFVVGGGLGGEEKGKSLRNLGRLEV
jgi:hypothetical protein